MKPVHIFLVDDHLLFRIGLRGILDVAGSDYEIVGEASSAEELFAALPQKQVDVMLLDIVLPDVSGIDIAARLRKEYPDIKILMLSAESDERMIIRLMEIGIDGFIGKNVASDELLRAIDYVADGAEYYGRDIARIIHCVRVSKRDVSDSIFTQRENEIISCCVKGLQAKEIANKLNIGIGTVNTHKNNIFKKLGINNSVELVNYCIKNGIVKA